MSQISLENVFNEMFAAIDACLKADIKLPALLLAYTLIDIAGWLNSEKSVGAGFTDWVEIYLLPNSALPCSSRELYDARQSNQISEGPNGAYFDYLNDSRRCQSRHP